MGWGAVEGDPAAAAGVETVLDGDGAMGTTVVAWRAV